MWRSFLEFHDLQATKSLKEKALARSSSALFDTRSSAIPL